MSERKTKMNASEPTRSTRHKARIDFFRQIKELAPQVLTSLEE
jgi:hypothetical protein